MLFLLVIITSYLSGSIPFGVLIAKRNHIDIKKAGSGNIGATNIGRILGFRYGILAGLLDFLKGFIPTFIAVQLFGNPALVCFVGLAALFGHLFPVFLKFSGGKGIATFGGTLLAIMGIKMFLFIFIVWLLCLFVIRIMSLTNLILSLVVPLVFFFGARSSSLFYLFYSILVAIFLWWSHRENILRLLKGTERKF
jgi:acyl phosphate:glycerol-3-phosphate acyltransferase